MRQSTRIKIKHALAQIRSYNVDRGHERILSMCQSEAHIFQEKQLVRTANRRTPIISQGHVWESSAHTVNVPIRSILQVPAHKLGCILCLVIGQPYHLQLGHAVLHLVLLQLENGGIAESGSVRVEHLLPLGKTRLVTPAGVGQLGFSIAAHTRGIMRVTLPQGSTNHKLSAQAH